MTRPAAGARQRRRAHLVRRGRTRRAPSTATGSATSASTSSAGAARVETVFGAFDVGARATTSSSRGRRRTAGSRKVAERASRCGPTASRPTRHIAPPKRYLVAVRPAARARAVLRARPAGAGRAAARRGRRRGGRRADRGLHQAPRQRARAASSARSTPTRSTRSTSSAGTAASTPTRSTSRDFEPITGRVHQPPPVHQVFEGYELRHLQLRAAQGRLPPAVDPGALLPLQRRQRRDHVLRRRRLRGAQGLGHRQGLDLAAPRRPRARPAARRVRAARSASSTSTSSPSWSTRSARSSSARAGVRSTTAATRGRGSAAGRAGGAERLRLADGSPARPRGRHEAVTRRTAGGVGPCGYSAEGSQRAVPRRGAADTGGSTWEARVQDSRGSVARGALRQGQPRRPPRPHHAGSCWPWRRSAGWAPPRSAGAHPPVRTGATTAGRGKARGRPFRLTVLGTSDTHGNVLNWDYFKDAEYDRQRGTTTWAWPRSRPWSRLMRAGAGRRQLPHARRR